MKIAICDDNQEYINILKSYLDKMTEYKFKYDSYLNGEGLISAYEEDEEFYDAIFLDMEMQGKNGIEVANIIIKIDKHV